MIKLQAAERTGGKSSSMRWEGIRVEFLAVVKHTRLYSNLIPTLEFNTEIAPL